jgi:hypothetical protein
MLSSRLLICPPVLEAANSPPSPLLAVHMHKHLSWATKSVVASRYPQMSCIPKIAFPRLPDCVDIAKAIADVW